MALRGPEPPDEVARSLFAGLAPSYDRLVGPLSLGQDRRWQQAMVDAVSGGLERVGDVRPPRILDVAAGTGRVSEHLVRAGSAEVVGVDLSLEMLSGARRRTASSTAGPRAVFVAGRAEALPFPDAAFDGLSFTYVLRYVADVEGTLAELARVLAPGAPMASLDFAVPAEPWWEMAWRLYTGGVLPVLGWALGGRPWRDVAWFLLRSITDHARAWPPERLVEAWERAGMVGVRARRMSLGGGLVMWGRRGDG